MLAGMRDMHKPGAFFVPLLCVAASPHSRETRVCCAVALTGGDARPVGAVTLTLFPKVLAKELKLSTHLLLGTTWQLQLRSFQTVHCVGVLNPRNCECVGRY